ncbi:MAG TPA: hypothetical protein VK968_09665 [Roseimicrobium sp.]|nr:hypothetical protein [Roseimicrobium sp.]
MKTLATIVLTAGVAFAGAYVVVTNQQHAQADKDKAAAQAQWETQKAQLEKDLKAAKNRAPRVELQTKTVEVPAEGRPAQEILNQLIALKPNSEESRNQSLRKIIHQMESLVDMGPNSVTAIRAFLGQNQDVEYEREREQNTDPNNNNNGRGGPGGAPGGPGGPGGFNGFGGNTGRNGLPRTDFLTPPSLRLGLFMVLKEVGGAEAEQGLAEVLGSTARPIEVAFLTRILQDMVPDKYKDIALAAAKELLVNPIITDSKSRLDENSKGYLYSVLILYNDNSFVEVAKGMLVGANGQVDRSALTYLNTMMKDQIMSVLLTAVNDTRITNNFDRATLLGTAFNFVGNNPQADQLLRDIVTKPLPENARREDGFIPFMALSRMDNGDLSEQTIRNRQQLLTSMKTSITDERLIGMVDRTISNLERKLNPDAAPAADQGGRRNRTRGGN